MHRTQIYLAEEQTQQLDEQADAQGVSRSTLIRQAVDEYLARSGLDVATWQSRWQQAVQRTAGIAPYLSEGTDYVEQLREADARRLRELTR